MAQFTTRVELYGNPSFQVYTDLHSQMQSKGFFRAIKQNDKSLWLPNAEYLYPTDSTPQQVLELAKVAASSVWKDFGVLVTKTEVGLMHYNLKPMD